MDASKSSFYQHLLTLTKTEIDDIRILFDCDVKSGLKKQDFALAVADYFLNESEYWMRRLPCTDIQFIDQILDAGPDRKVDVGYLPYESILEEYGIVIAEYDDDENCSFSVDEFMYKAFKTGIDNAKAFMMAKDCIQYEALVRGALNVYGVIPYDDMVSLLKSEVIDYDDFYCITQDGIQGIINLVTEELVFPSISATNKFIGIVNEFSNHIPHWSLKGWSPAEVFQKFDKPELNLNHGQTIQSPLDMWSDRKVNDVFNLSRTVKKVGRNEPCPCGSGKKYKDCHGKYQS